MSEPTILDSAGNRLQVGDRVTDGGNSVGTISEILADEGRWSVEVYWPPEPPVDSCIESYLATAWDYRHEGPEPTNFCTTDLTLIPTQEDD